MHAHNLAKALGHLALAGVLSVPAVGADERDTQTAAASLPITLERRDALEVAAADPTLPDWQREIMRTITQRPIPRAIRPSREAGSFSNEHIAGMSDDGEWFGVLPTGRWGHTAIYDPVRDRMVVFGGNDGTYLDEVWVLPLSGSPAWSTLAPSGNPPPGREGHTAIYDPVRDQMVVFAGYDGGFRNDVWTLSLSESPAWNALTPTGTPPPARFYHTAIYDPVRDRMVVFAGFKNTGTDQNDVWVLTLSGSPAWSELAPPNGPPPELNGHTAIYDPVRDRMVVFGGSYGLKEVHSDVWALTLSGSPAWSALSPAGTPPPGLLGHTAFFDPVGDRMVVFGGFDGSPLTSDVWALTLSGSGVWSELTPSGSLPPVRYEHTAIYDPVRSRMVVFGGAGGVVLNDTWAMTLSGSPAWSALAPPGTPQPALYEHAAFHDPERDRMVVFGGFDGGYRNDVWILTLSGSPAWSGLATSGSPPAGRYGHTVIHDPVRDRMVVFGGYDGSSFRNDVWALTLSGSPAWSLIVPSGSPPLGRFGHTAFYDPVRDRMVMFGGFDGSIVRNDVWVLTLSGSPAWSAPAPSGSSPPGLYGHSAIFDPVRDRMVVFGGFDGANYRNEVWTLTLSGSLLWSTLAPSGSPPVGRYRHTAIYDPMRDRMVVFGGSDGNPPLRDDVWALGLLVSPAWREMTPSGGAPQELFEHTAIYDPPRDQMVVLGRTDNSARSHVRTLRWNFKVDQVAASPRPSRLLLHPARPNPTHSSAELRYEIASDGHVSLDVLDIQGRIARRLRHGIQTAGRHSVAFDRRDDQGRSLPAGIYLIRLTTRNEAGTTRIVLLP